MPPVSMSVYSKTLGQKINNFYTRWCAITEIYQIASLIFLMLLGYSKELDNANC